MHGRLWPGQRIIAHGAAGAVGSMVTQLAREFDAYVIDTGSTADPQSALDFSANEFDDLEDQLLDDVGAVHVRPRTTRPYPTSHGWSLISAVESIVAGKGGKRTLTRIMLIAGRTEHDQKNHSSGSHVSGSSSEFCERDGD